MSAPYVCSSCRRHSLNKLGRILGRQWLPRRTFISLADSKKSTEDTRQDLLDIVDSPGTTVYKTPVRLQKPPPRQPLNPATNKGDLLESFFEDGLRSEESGQLNTAALDPEPYTYFETINKMMKKPSAGIASTWRYFISHLGPDVWAQNGINPQLPGFTTTTGNLLTLFMRERTRPNAPSATEFVETFFAMGLLSLKYWRRIAADILVELSNLRIKIATLQSANEDHEALQSCLTREKELAEDLLGMWRALLVVEHPDIHPSELRGENRRSDWSFLKIDKRIVKKHVRFEFSFTNLLMPRHGAGKMNAIAACAVQTFELLGTCGQTLQGHHSEHHPFLKALAKLISFSNPSAIASLMDRHKSTEAEWAVLYHRAVDMTASDNASSGFEPTKRFGNQKYTYSRPVNHSTQSIHERLTTTLVARDLNTAMQLWNEAQSNVPLPETANDSERAPQTALTYELYNHFITVFMRLQQPQQAIAVWNRMVELSMTPTPASWNAMLEGCKTMRDATALEAVWLMLMKSGVRPDMICWTTRISGLIEAGKPIEAIKALEEMGNLWLTAARKSIKDLDVSSAGDVDGFVKPTIENVNAAIAGLIRRRHDGAANRVLAWGGKLGIKPNIITYNTLLRPLAREGRTETVQALLKHMQQQGIQADVATFTTLLDETLRSAAELSADQQLEAVNRILSEMEAAGIEANQITYGKIIYSLLQSPSNDLTAVQAVMKRMGEQGISPNSYMYTTLMEYHFSREPPNLEAIRAILERVRTSSYIVDHIFWDRVIEGYARIKDTGSALAILGKTDRAGRRVSWWTLTEVLEALAQNGEWELAKQVVTDVKADRGGALPLDQKGHAGQHEFWRLVSELKVESV